MDEYAGYPLHEFEIWRGGRSWSLEEKRRKWRLHPEVPEKLEYFDGKVFWSDGQRITMLGWMLEQLGADVAVRLGDLDVWRAAVADAERACEGKDPIRDDRPPADASENLDEHLYGEGGPV